MHIHIYVCMYVHLCVYIYIYVHSHTIMAAEEGLFGERARGRGKGSREDNGV